MSKRTFALMLVVVLIIFGILWYAASSVNKAFGDPPAAGRHSV
jgi:hypothetical protein